MNAPTLDGLLLLAPALPLLVALMWTVPALRPGVRCLIPWVPLPALLLALVASPDHALDLDWLMLGGQLGLHELTRVFLGFTALIWILGGLHARAELARGQAAGTFPLYWMLTLGGNLGVILALDVALFYTSFALMTFAAFGLIIQPRHEHARRAGRVYLVLAVLGEALLLLGFLLAAQATQQPLAPQVADLPQAIAGAAHRDLIMAALWLGFGVKAGLPFLHFSLPLIYSAAPVSAAAVMAGAMLKAGLLGWLLTFPLGVTSLPLWGGLLIATGLFAAFAAALIGIHQRLPRSVLAYSSISQIGMMTIGLGAWLWRPDLGPALALALTLFATHHALSKTALFLSTDAPLTTSRHRLWTWGVVLLPPLALVGLLPGGALAKLALKDPLHHAMPPLPPLWHSLPLLIALATVGTTLLVARFLWLLSRHPGATDAVPAGIRIAWLLAAAASVGSLLLLPLWGATLPDKALLPAVPTLVWPVAVGVALALFGRQWLQAWPVPNADALVLFRPIPGVLFGVGRQLTALLVRLRAASQNRVLRLLQVYRRIDRRLGRLFEHLWQRDAALVFGLLLVILMVAPLVAALR